MAITIRAMSERALRLLGELDAEEDISDVDGATALEAFQAMFLQFVATQAFGPITDTLQAGAYTAKENERVIGATSVTLPSTINDCGVVRAPRDRSVVVVAGATPTTNIFDADLNAWVPIHALTLDSAAPLSTRYREGITALLAVELAAEFGSEIPGRVAQNADKGRYAITRRNFRAAPVQSALLRANPDQGMLGQEDGSVDVTTIGAEIPDMAAIFYSALNQ